jgi:hypothetical protein
VAQIEREEPGHIYRVDGVVVPGVTEMCGIYGDDVDEYVEEKMERAADRGVTMHLVLEMALRGDDYDGEYPAMYEDHVQCIERFLSEHEVVPLAIEEPIYSPRLCVAGTPDLLCIYDGVLALLDYKFVSAINKRKVRAQLTGYNEIYNDNGVFPEQMWAIHFTKERPKPYPVEFGGDEWATALKAWEINHRKYKRGIIG